MIKLFLIGATLALAGICTAIPDYASTIRVPAFPLAVRNPYTNFWLGANQLPGSWPMFWTTKTKGWTGMVRVDGKNYIWMGRPMNAGELMGELAVQKSHFITPTQTVFHLTAGEVDLNVTFFSPVEYENIMKQSIPVSYVTVNVASNDALPHVVQIYMDITGEWATSDLGQIVTWDQSSTPSGLRVWSTQLQTQTLFSEFEDYPKWGRAILATDADASYASGSDFEVRTRFLTNGSLGNVNDEDFRCASCSWPTFGFSHDLLTVTASEKSVRYVVGLVREINANFLGEQKEALWLSYWPTSALMIDFFWGDYENALRDAETLDAKILTDAFNAKGLGQSHADILALSLRQAYAGNEFSGTKENPIYYQKEISSGAFMQTVDVIYPGTPMYYYLNINYLKLLLDPLFNLMEEGVWTRPFAMHDIGAPYPNGLGQAYGGDMPVEESANMIMMVADIIFHPQTPVSEGVAYANLHINIMKKWADYLVENCLYPVNQLTTDDFIGPTELNSGLALKGILGLASFAKISSFVGNETQAAFYNNIVQSYVPIWFNESLHIDGTHLKMEYNVTNGYQFKYNAFHDLLLNLNVVPQNVYDMEAAYYLSIADPYGIPFVSTHDYTKSDWEMWTAAAFGEANPQLRTTLVETLKRFLQITPQRVPFTDWYVTATSNHVGFQARPVAGGHFAILALEEAKKTRVH